ncbi:kinase domain protein (macronuclear) [Tetrahymena thermophila SB210]|uniref:Kinase domain protein n=1 Tax=Tetrahymena thermophila (strain SB210) TaxID=312017 RepID=I7MLQ6_TETTS|nr:kinase domain protein [Tetrahymena thermophila SB210]EAS02884.2 kinase domain protein [Tetrahymena thermophila SB210]|eukprot:XP_001023129.2 kinase domain protein [Tetrahymena thermophila SB210]
MNLQAQQKTRKQSKGQILEIFEQIKPTHYIQDTANGVSTKSFTKQIRYQSQNPKMSNQKELTDFQRTELEKQKRNQEYLFHIGNHARTVSDILKFRYDQYKQTLGQQEQQSEEQQRMQYQNQQSIWQNSTTMIQQYQQYHQAQESNIKRSNTLSNLQSQKSGVKICNSASKQSEKNQNTQKLLYKPAQIQSQKAISSILGSAESNISPIKKSYNEDLATAGDTRDNFASLSGGSLKSNPNNFSFQDRKYVSEKDYLSIQRNLFDSIDTQKNSSIQNQQCSSIVQSKKESDEIDFNKQSKLEKQNNQTFNKEDRLLQSPASLHLNQKSQSQDYLAQKNPTQQQQMSPHLIQPSHLLFVDSQQNQNQINYPNQFISSISQTSGQQNQTQEQFKIDQFKNNQINNNQKFLNQINYSQYNSIPSLDISQAQNKEGIINTDIKPIQKYQENLQSTSTIETNQLAQANKITESKFTNFAKSNDQSQMQSASDIYSFNQPYSTSQISSQILSTERQFKIKLTKITKDSQISEEYQINKSPSSFTQLENKQDLLIKFAEARKQEHLNNLYDDAQSDFSKTPQTNKSEVIKRFKASQIFDQNQSQANSKPSQNKSSQIYYNNNSQYDFANSVKEINNEHKYTNLMSSAQQQNLSHQIPTLSGMGRINNFIRKSQEGNKQSNYFTQISDSQIQNAGNVTKQSASFNPNYHLLESYTNSLVKQNNNETLNPLNTQNQIKNLIDYNSPKQNIQNIQASGLYNQSSFQQETKSSLSMIKNIFESTLNNQENPSNQNLISSSPKNLELNIILSKYQSNKEKQNLRQSSQFQQQTPSIQLETKNSFAKSIDQHFSQQNTRLSNTLAELNQSSQVKNSLTVLENQKIQQIMDDIQAKISLKKSQSLEQSGIAMQSSSNKFSQYFEKKTSNSQVIDNGMNEQNGLIVSFANNSLVGQSTIESSKNIANQMNYYINSASQIVIDEAYNKQKIEKNPVSAQFILQDNQTATSQTDSKKDIENPTSQNNYNLTLEGEQNQSDNPPSERKKMHADFSSDKSQKGEQDKTFDSENRDEMSIKQTTQFEKKAETLSNTYDMSQLLCQTPLQQHGQHIRLMSGGNMEHLTLNNSIQSTFPFEQIQSNQTTSYNNYSNFTTSNNLQSANNHQSKNQEVGLNLQNSFDNGEQNIQIQVKSSQITRQSQEKREQQNPELELEKKSSKEIGRSQDSNLNTPQKCSENLQQLLNDNQQSKYNTPQTIVSAQPNELENQNIYEDQEVQYVQTATHNQERELQEYDKQNFTNPELLNQSKQLQESQNRDLQVQAAHHNKEKELQEYNNQNIANIEQLNKSKQLQESQKGDQNQQENSMLQGQIGENENEKQKNIQKNINHVRFNNLVKQMQENSPCHNLGYYHYETINIDGKILKDVYQQTDNIEKKEISVQTIEQSKRNSIFDECTKLFSPKMKFIEPEFKDNECMMLNMSNNSSQYDHKDSIKEQHEGGFNYDQNQQKNLRKSDFFKQQPNQQQQQQTSSNGNHETGIINSSLYNSQKLASDNEEVIKRQYQIYDKIFDAGELPVVDCTEQDNIFKEWYQSDQSNFKNRRYSNQISDSEKKNIQQQIDNIVNKRAYKNQQALMNQQKNSQSNQPQIGKNKSKQQTKVPNKQNQKSIKFNNKIETRNIPKNSKQKNSAIPGNNTERVFERLYPKQVKQQQEQIFEIKKDTSKSKSKGRATSQFKTQEEMDFIKINKQKVPYMMRKKVEDKFQLFKKAVEVNLENMIQDQKSHQIKSIVLDDEIKDQDNLQEIYQRSLSNRTQKNLVSYDSQTMTNLARYNPSYNP